MKVTDVLAESHEYDASEHDYKPFDGPLEAWWEQNKARLMPEMTEICVSEIERADIYWDDETDVDGPDLGDEASDATHQLEKLIHLQFNGNRVDDDEDLDDRDADSDDIHDLARQVWREVLIKYAHEHGLGGRRGEDEGDHEHRG